MTRSYLGFIVSQLSRLCPALGLAWPRSLTRQFPLRSPRETPPSHLLRRECRRRRKQAVEPVRATGGAKAGFRQPQVHCRPKASIQNFHLTIKSRTMRLTQSQAHDNSHSYKKIIRFSLFLPIEISMVGFTGILDSGMYTPLTGISSLPFYYLDEHRSSIRIALPKSKWRPYHLSTCKSYAINNLTLRVDCYVCSFVSGLRIETCRYNTTIRSH